MKLCTSLTLHTKSDHQLLARTMDFPTTTPWQPIYLPAGETWRSIFMPNQHTKYAILGSGRTLDQFRLMGDGFNSAGLACAELYFPNRAVYHDAPVSGKQNLTPQDLILWFLGNYGSIAEIEADLPNIALIGQVWFKENKVYPFHWILTDKSGRTAVLEPTSLELKLVDDPVAVLTNTPELANHIGRLNQFLNVDEPTFNEETVHAAQTYLASNTPLPKGPVPTKRFISAAINRWGQKLPDTDEQAETELFDTLEQVALPLDPAKIARSNHNYTHYESVLNLETQIYYYRAMTNHRLQRISLLDLAKNGEKKMIIFPNE